MSKPSEFAKALYKKLNPILGIEPKVFGYADEKNKSKIDILQCPDPTDKKVMFYSTLALSELALHNENHEILMAAYSSFDKIPNILSTCAFFIINNKWESKLGVVFETLVEEYYPNKEVKHFFLQHHFYGLINWKISSSRT